MIINVTSTDDDGYLVEDINRLKVEEPSFLSLMAHG
jgi:hypothetical protein